MEPLGINGSSQGIVSIPAGPAVQSIANVGTSFKLPSSVSSSDIIELTGALTSDVVVTVATPMISHVVGTTGPYAIVQSWVKIVRNNTSGTFNVTVRGPGGRAIFIAQGTSETCYSENGIDVFLAGPGSGVVAQNTWHFDALLGNDTNDGLTAGTALKTWAQYTNRTGAVPRFPIKVDYYVHGDMLPSDALSMTGVLVGGAAYVHFVPNANQILRTSTLTGVVHYSNPARVREEIQDAGFDFTPHVGKMVKVITGAANANYCYILSVPALGRAFVGFVGTVDPTDPYLSYLSGVNVVGQSYQIIQRPKVYQFYEDVEGIAYQPGGIASVGFLLEYGDFSACPPFVTTMGRRELSTGIAINSCNLTNMMLHDSCGPSGCIVIDGTSYSLGRIVASFHELLRSNMYIDGSMELFGATFESCVDPLVFNTLFSDAPTSWLTSHHVSYGIAIFNCTRWGVFHEGATLLLEAGLWGSGNHGLVLQFSDGGRCLVDDDSLATNPFNVLTDVSPEMTLDGYSSLPAVDPVTFASTAPATRLTTFANWLATVGAGGFGRRLFDPTCPATCVMNTPP